MKITKIKSNSLAEKIGMQPGDRLLKINGKKVIDEIDYKFRITEELLILDLEINGKLDRVEIEKEYDDDLGVLFEEMKIRACANDCVFCFVDQNPPNLRDGLYFRDGDYRMSYLYGHYITMTNMGKSQLERVVEQRMSPLYVSIHVTDKDLRQKLFLYKKDDNILEKIKYLTDNKIELHTQIVVMPNINDEKYLDNTLSDLYKFHPLLKTCTLVPVGLTKHRKGLMDLSIVDKGYAVKMIENLYKLRTKYSGLDNPFILCSDEWYILSDLPFPNLSEYGDLDLIENGVGQVQQFIERFDSEVSSFPKSINKPRKVTLITGTLIENIFTENILPALNKIKNLEVNLVAIENEFFGKSVTVSGLLSGQDIINKLTNSDLGDEVWMSHRILNEEGTYTLDNMTINDISKTLGCPVKIGKDSFRSLLKGLNNV